MLVREGRGESHGATMQTTLRAAALMAALAACAPAEPASSRFRARGNEPGWMAVVELGDAPTLHAEVDYGERKLDVGAVAETRTGWSGVTADGTAVTLELERAPCLDDMSGEKFAARARLSVGDRTFRGCGSFEP
jgi:uncharacterized membrane protein